MILPIGHENQEVRRLPWVTFFLIAACLVAHLFVSRNLSRMETDVRRVATSMLRYWAQHPYLQLDPEFISEMGISETDLQRLESMLPPSTPPLSSVELEDEQRELDRLTGELLNLRLSAPYYRWGLVPKRMGLPGLLTHMFVHGGWLHLIGNLLLLYLTGPFVEDIWGRWLYALFYVGMGVLSGLMFCMHYPQSTSPLIGASGAIAAVMGAFLVYFWKTRIRFAFFLGFLFTGTFKAPAWMMVPLWAGLELLNAGTMDRLTAGQGGGVAHWAHVWGFVFGFAGAMLLKWTHFVERRIAPVLEKATSIRNQSLEAYEEGILHLDKGRYEQARDCFVAASRAHPGDLDILEYLELVTRRTGETGLFLQHAGRAIEARLHRKDAAAALGVYQRLRQDTPVETLPIRVSALLVPQLLAAGEAKEARALLEHVIDHAGPDIPAGLIIPLVEPAQQMGKTMSRRLEQLTAGRPDIPESLKQSLAAPASTASAGATGRNRQLRITPAVPTRLGADRLMLRLKDSGEKALELSRIHSIGVAAVSASNQPLLLLIDLFLDDPATDAGVLRTIRLASNTYDPRPLAAPHAKLGQAFCVFIQGLLERSRAGAWPDARILDIGRIPRFPDLESYRRSLTDGQE